MNLNESSLKNLVSSEELAELNIEELMEVQGGVDTDEDFDDCTSYQCKSKASAICATNA